MRVGLLVLSGSLLAAPASLPAQTKKPVSFESLVGMQMASDPQIAPDGRTVAFSVSVPSLEANRNISRIWVASLASGAAPAPRPLTTGPGSDFAPRPARSAARRPEPAQAQRHARTTRAAGNRLAGK